MKLNQELIKRLANGEIQLKHTGTVGQLNEILKAAFPKDTSTSSVNYLYYFADLCMKSHWDCEMNLKLDTPIFTTEQLFESDRLPDVGNMSKTHMESNETRELAKQLFVAYCTELDGEDAMDLSIQQAKIFIQRLDKNGL